MMLGTVAASGARRAAAQGDLPAGAVAFLDFVAGAYYAGGAWRAVTDLLGGGFDAGEISAAGMYVDFGNSNRPTPVGPLLADLVTQLAPGMTILFEVTTASDLAGCLFYIGDDPDYNAATVYNQAYIVGGVYDDGDVSVTTTISGAGAHRIAVTFNRDAGGGDYEFAWSHDGNAALTQTVAYAASAMTDAQIGWDGNAGDGRNLYQTYIRSMTVYPALPPEDLPALTDLPTA